MQILFSLIVPVYNRPQEIDELLASLCEQTVKPFEVVIVEDGSNLRSEDVVKRYQDKLQITYFYKSNSGPGDSRNFGMKNATGNYFLILDSDCILPPDYLKQAHAALEKDYVDCFGGVDTALATFTPVQKAINFAMTSVLTTGGVRGGSEKLGKFQPRSFNMGLSRKAFDASGGFGSIHPGEDPDLSFRLWKLGFETRLFSQVSVYHKRRIDWDKFYTQVNKFGKVRPILNLWHPEYKKLTYWFPSLFLIGGIGSFICALVGYPVFLLAYLLYFFVCFVMASLEYKSMSIGGMACRAVFTQFLGYGSGFLLSFLKLKKESPEKAFPELFFNKRS
ncbi:glycosyl transferase family 2 [Leadbetterella byssophila DSM 17132]|uniref:Glycosyl transferase family 2 n=1 Tax=Leadbetterella byssophila (strain DSM 17132 / JCM 16389 / KACC 11308 / NBRC 106382 / 4M15) TaxID=649349 RepID=E4RXZ4_LEAB4|nr:glycosyltransferase [Leadbetterella byssophila]ADQ16322.1 glycosyl transferase family 2 [Leadbetterella byssophila DSM 17132]